MDYSPLNRLTPELRKRIFKYCLPFKNDVTVPPGNAVQGTGKDHDPKIVSPLSLLRVCRGIEREAAALVYHDNRFVYVPRPFDLVEPAESKKSPNAFQRSGRAISMLYEELFQQLNGPPAPVTTHWDGALVRWLGTIGSVNRSHIRSLTIDLGTWELETLEVQDVGVSSRIYHLSTHLPPHIRSICKLVLHVRFPTSADTPCAVPLHFPLSSFHQSVRILQNLTKDAVAQLDSLWKQGRITYYLFRVLNRDLTVCQARLKSFFRDALPDVGVGYCPALALPQDVGSSVPAVPSSPQDGHDESVVTQDSSSHDDVADPNVKHEPDACTTFGLGIEKNVGPKSDEDQQAIWSTPSSLDEDHRNSSETDDDQVSLLSGRASSEIRQSRVFSPGGSTKRKYLDPHLVRPLASSSGRHLEDNVKLPAPGTHLTSTSVTGNTILEDWSFVAHSPVEARNDNGFNIPSTPNMPNVVANHLQARWNKQAAYMKKSHTETMARSPSMMNDAGLPATFKDPFTSSTTDRSESIDLPRISSDTNAIDMMPPIPTRDTFGRLRSRTSTSAKTMLSSSTITNFSMPKTPDTPTHPSFGGELRRSISPSPLTPTTSHSSTMHSRFAKRANLNRVVSPVVDTPELAQNGSSAPKNFSQTNLHGSQAPTETTVQAAKDEDQITVAPLKISSLGRRPSEPNLLGIQNASEKTPKATIPLMLPKIREEPPLRNHPAFRFPPTDGSSNGTEEPFFIPRAPTSLIALHAGVGQPSSGTAKTKQAAPIPSNLVVPFSAFEPPSDDTTTDSYTPPYTVSITAQNSKSQSTEKNRTKSTKSGTKSKFRLFPKTQPTARETLKYATPPELPAWYLTDPLEDDAKAQKAKEKKEKKEREKNAAKAVAGQPPAFCPLGRTGMM